MTGLCECGCGKPAPLARANDRRKGYVRGQPKRFIHGHHGRGSGAHNWKGGRMKHSAGYVRILAPGHPRAGSQGYVFEHILIAERALGKPLPQGAEVHHLDGNKANNEGRNLVICQDRAFHALLHRRARALGACGNASWEQCVRCREWGPPDEVRRYRRRANGQLTAAVHPRCASKSRLRDRERAKGD